MRASNHLLQMIARRFLHSINLSISSLFWFSIPFSVMRGASLAPLIIVEKEDEGLLRWRLRSHWQRPIAAKPTWPGIH
jgi:hypothetical protein